LVAAADGGIWMTEIEMDETEDPQALLQVGVQLGPRD
jgi:hypothetical protein